MMTRTGRPLPRRVRYHPECEGPLLRRRMASIWIPRRRICFRFTCCHEYSWLGGYVVFTKNESLQLTLWTLFCRYYSTTVPHQIGWERTQVCCCRRRIWHPRRNKIEHAVWSGTWDLAWSRQDPSRCGHWPKSLEWTWRTKGYFEGESQGWMKCDSPSVVAVDVQANVYPERSFVSHVLV